MYERELKRLNPQMRNITYDVADLMAYFSGLQDVSALVYDGGSRKYTPHDREWVKEQVYNRLKQQASGGGRR